MLPVDQCNNCNNRGCKKEVFRNPLMGQLPCMRQSSGVLWFMPHNSAPSATICPR
jgi:hypothetical protein